MRKIYILMGALFLGFFLAGCAELGTVTKCIAKDFTSRPC